MKTVRAYARTLLCLLFVASPVLAEDYVCGEFRHLSKEAIGFVAERQGLDWNVANYKDSNFESVLSGNGGTVFLFTGPTPSDRLLDCLEVLRRLTPGIEDLFNGTLSRLGAQPPPEVVEMILSSLPEEKRDEHRDEFLPLLGVGESVTSGMWTIKVFATAFDEPDRSLSAIDFFLGRPSNCAMRQDCRDAFAEFVGEP